MSGYLVLRWVSLLLDLTVKSALLLTGAAACLMLLRRASAAARHLVWLLTFGSLLCLPLLSATLPGWHARAWPHLLPTSAGRRTFDTESTRRHGDTEAVGLGKREMVPRAVHASFLFRPDSVLPCLRVDSPSGFRGFALSRFRVLKQSVATFSSHRSGSPTVWPATLLLIWLAGAAAVLAQVGVGLAQVRRMGRRCPRVTEGPLVILLRELNREIGQPRPVILRMAPEDSRSIVPMTWGWARPVVLLPADAAAWPEERLRSVLLHELAHVRRGDWPAQLLTYAACALYWCHPLIWLAARQMRLESERACDDRVLNAGVPGPDYAAHLLEIVRALGGRRRPLSAALTATPQSPIERRLRSILEPRRSRRAAPRWAVPLALAMAAAIVIPLAGVRPVDETRPREPRRLAVQVSVKPVAPRRSTPRGSRIAILETTGRTSSLEQVAPRRPRRGRAFRAAPSRSPQRSSRSTRRASPLISRPRQPKRPASLLLAVLPPAMPTAIPAALPEPAPEPMAVPVPEPAPEPMAVPVPAGFVRADSDTDSDAGTASAAAGALVDAQSQPHVAEPASADDGMTHLAATVAPDGSQPADPPREPEQDTADLPAAGQVRDVSPTPATAVAPPIAPCIRWAALKDIAAPLHFVAQEVLFWDPHEGEWVRLLMVWDPAQPGSGPSPSDPNGTPAAAETPWDREADPANDLMEPGANAEELPLWEQLFDRWEKALADRQREQEHPAPAAAPATL